MLTEIIIDTNTLKHASDEKYHNQQDCIDFIELLMDSHELVCIDEGVHGHIYFEYNKHLKPGMLGYTFLLKVSNPNSNNRIKIINKTLLPININQKINRTGIKKPDRIFVWVCYTSADKVLVSQEYEDFTVKRRRDFRKDIGVKIMEAGEFVANY